MTSKDWKDEPEAFKMSYVAVEDGIALTAKAAGTEVSHGSSGW
jgi:hypothetical protein